MVLYVCGICEIETNVAGLTELDESIMQRIHLSDMNLLYQEMIELKPDARSCDIGYANAVRDELTCDGLLKGAAYVCKQCIRQLPKVPNKKTNIIVVDIEQECMDDIEVVVESDSERDDSFVEENGNDADTAISGDEHEIVMDTVRRGGVPSLALVNGYFRGKCRPSYC